MDYTMGIAALVLTVILWLLYHKIVTVIYHGNMGSHIIKELFGCFIVSVLLVSTVSVVAGKLLSAVGGVLLFLLKAALIVAGIAVVVFLIATIAKAISSKKSDGNDSCDRSSKSVAKPVSEKNRSGEQPYEVVPSEADNTEISKYIKENFAWITHSHGNGDIAVAMMTAGQTWSMMTTLQNMRKKSKMWKITWRAMNPAI